MRRRQAFAEKDAFHQLAERVVGRELRVDELSDSILADMFESRYGRAPHPRMKRETMVARLGNDAGNGRAELR